MNHRVGTSGGDSGSAPAPADPAQGDASIPIPVILTPSGPADAGSPTIGQPSGGESGAMTLVQALQINLAESINIPQLGTTDANFTITGRVTITASASGMSTFHLEICDFQFDSGKNQLVLVVPPAAVNAFPPLDFGVMLPQLAPGAPVVTPQLVELVGWKAANPATDPLPTDSRDPRVLDPDNDRNPGITADMTKPINAEVYLVARAKLQLTGTLQSLERTTGTATGLIELSIVDASDNAVPIGPITATAVNRPTSDTFLMVSIPGTTNQCADILAQRPTLFQ